MTKKLSSSANPSPSAAIRECAELLLKNGAHPGDLSYELAVAATRHGIDLSPTTGVALAVVLKAVSDVALERANQFRNETDDAVAAAALRSTLH